MRVCVLPVVCSGDSWMFLWEVVPVGLQSSLIGGQSLRIFILNSRGYKHNVEID